MINDQDGGEPKGAAMLRHVGKAKKKLKAMTKGAPQQPQGGPAPLGQGMTGMNPGSGS